jgi:aspartyl/glutamyl-tRNA(Asn/Gln) amidotransferase C subunit
MKVVVCRDVLFYLVVFMIDETMFARICNLSKLTIAPAEKAAFVNKLEAVLEWVDELSNINVADFENATDFHEQNDMLSDKTPDVGQMDNPLDNTEHTKLNMFLVPKVVE